MTIDVRILTAGESDVLANVAPDLFDFAVDARLATEFLNDPRHHLAVALDQGVAVGFASGVHYVHPDKPSQLWINEVSVASSHQGQGIGKAVVNALLQHARLLGCEEAWVLTNRSNLAAMRLYASTGGTESVEDEVMFTFKLD